MAMTSTYALGHPMAAPMALQRIRDLLELARRNKGMMLGPQSQVVRDMATIAYCGAVDEIVTLLSALEGAGLLVRAQEILARDARAMTDAATPIVGSALQ